MGGSPQSPVCCVCKNVVVSHKNIYTKKNKKKDSSPDEGMGRARWGGGERGAVVCLDTDFGAEIVCLCGMAISILFTLNRITRFIQIVSSLFLFCSFHLFFFFFPFFTISACIFVDMYVCRQNFQPFF